MCDRCGEDRPDDSCSICQSDIAYLDECAEQTSGEFYQEITCIGWKPTYTHNTPPWEGLAENIRVCVECETVFEVPSERTHRPYCPDCSD